MFYISKILTDKDILNVLQPLGLHLFYKPINVAKEKCVVYDDNGYYYHVYWGSLYKGHSPNKFHSYNKYTIQNINTYLKGINSEYRVSDKIPYINNKTSLEIIHLSCNQTFMASLLDLQGKRIKGNSNNKYYKQCPHCYKFHTESHHASALKQVFIHEYPDTVLEDKSCINSITGRILPTDIVNHKLKIAIEVQSQWHDYEDKQQKDKIKKDFWINQMKYALYTPDIRNYSILEMIQLFFPQIKEIPSYVNYNFSEVADFTKVQELLDKGYTTKEVTKLTNYTFGCIHDMIANKKVVLPSDYKKKFLNQKVVIQLDQQGNFINKFESKTDADRHGYKYGTISRVLFKKQNFAYNCYWVFEDDYINGNYEIPSIPKDKYLVGVDKYTMDNKFVKHYDSIYDAEKDSKCDRYEIYRIISNKRKSTKNEKWRLSTNH